MIIKSCYDFRSLVDEKRPEVLEVQGWLSTDNVELLPARSGVYVFVDAPDDVKYIGKAGARRMKDEVKDAISRGKNRGDGWVKALYTNSDDVAKTLETTLIDKYDPPNNKT